MKKIRIRLMAIMVLVLVSATVITACGRCEHDYADGICTLCGEADPNYKGHDLICTHSYDDGVCTKCGTACTHSYIDGTCTNCGLACSHAYVESVCAKCGVSCAHNYNEGVCADCSAEDPDYIPADNGRSMYNEIVEKFKYLVLYKYMNEELPPRSGNDPFYMDALYEVVGLFTPALNFGYSYKDIDGDGYVELLLVENANRLYAMFTIKDKSPAVVATFQQGMGYLSNDGTVFFNSKEFASDGGQIYLGNHITRLVDGELVGITYGWEDADGDYDTQNDEIYYRISEDGVKTELSYDEYKTFKSAYNYYWEAPTRLTKLSNLKLNPALTESFLTDITADFSTYDAIIKTFGLIHSEVTGGKCVRSKWIGGAYDAGMIFETEEDFVIYNRLLAACVLVQSRETASFGYAKSDLNGDGVEELIFLDSKYYVLAIFTEVDGKVVLLDSYNDLRTAFIDANGLIHVQERIIPGSENDFEYFVYEVRGGELVAKVAVGIKFDSTGSQSKIYKISDGSATDIEQTEWDMLYAEYSLDIGTSSFESYTKDESGLTFVAASAN